MRHHLLRTTMFFSAISLLAIEALAAGTSATLQQEIPPSSETRLAPAESGTPPVPESRLETTTIVIDYRRDRIGRLKTARPSISQPAAGGLPIALGVVGPDTRTATSFRQQQDIPVGLDTRASVAATWTARQQIQIFGQREIYEAGFYDGLKQAFDDPLIGHWDHLQGDLAGSRDRQAYRIGSELGLRHARLKAGEDAHARIATQSRNTADRPRNTESSSMPEAAVDELAALMPPVREPRLLDVFQDLPLSTVLERSEPGSSPDPLKLYRSSNYQDFYDHSWTEPDPAFTYWLDHHRDRAFWRQLSELERASFARVFRSAYRHQLPELLTGRGEEAYGDGYGDGWSYGVRVVQEWRRRQGYHEGFTSALRTHAQSAYWKNYPSLFNNRYGELFREWSATARIEAREVAFVDASSGSRPQLSNLLASGD